MPITVTGNAVIKADGEVVMDSSGIKNKEVLDSSVSVLIYKGEPNSVFSENWYECKKCSTKYDLNKIHLSNLFYHQGQTLCPQCIKQFLSLHVGTLEMVNDK